VSSDKPSQNTSNFPQIRDEDVDIPSFEAERIPRLTWVLVPVAAALVALPGLGNHLLSDDFALVLGNVGQTFSDLLQPFFQQSTSRAAGGTYRPLTELSIGLDYFIWGASAFGFHLTNLLWHVLNSLLCFKLVRVMVPPRPVVALTAGLLFAVHPVHGDAIFWLSARSDLLVTFFYLASMILFVRGRGGRRRTPTLGSVLCFVAALLSKEVAISLPFLVVILDLAAPSTEGLRHRLRRHLPRYGIYFAVALAYLGLRVTVLPKIGLARWPSVGDALFNFGLYLKLTLIPMETHTGLRGVVVMFLGLVVLVVMFLRYARMGDRRNLALAASWMATIVVPMLDVPRRWQLYLPSVGFCIFLAIVMAGLVWRRDEDHPKRVSRIAGVGLALLILGGGLLLYQHATVYRRAGEISLRIITRARELVPDPGPNQTLYAANLPSVLTSWSGDQPMFAFGFDEALKMAYGRADVSGRVLSHVYVKDDGTARPTVQRTKGGALQMSTGGAAYAFSFHGPKMTSGRDRAVKGDVLEYGAWRTTIDRVQGQRVLAITVRPTRPLGPLLVWTGSDLQLMTLD
jgi:hypothetical protein